MVEDRMPKLTTLLYAGIAGAVLAAVPIEPSYRAPYGLEVNQAAAITYRRARVTYRRAYRRTARAAVYGAGAAAAAGYYYGGGYGSPYYGGGYAAPSAPYYGTGYGYGYPSYGYGYGGYRGYWRPYFGARPGLF
jgi:hypothetical protein